MVNSRNNQMIQTFKRKMFIPFPCHLEDFRLHFLPFYVHRAREVFDSFISHRRMHKLHRTIAFFLLERISVAHSNLPVPTTYLTSLTIILYILLWRTFSASRLPHPSLNNWREDRRNLQDTVMYFSRNSSSLFYFCNRTQFYSG